MRADATERNFSSISLDPLGRDEAEHLIRALLAIDDLPDGVRSRILERGERLDRQHPGQGIGLAVVKDIIESYNAKLMLGDSPMGGAAP